jgi:hypothetical protein
MEIEPLLLSIPQTSQTVGRCVATIYDLIGAGELDARKSDGRTLVTMESIKRYVDKLPKAEIAPRPKRNPQHLREGRDRQRTARQAEAATAEVATRPKRKPQHLRQAETTTLR